MSLSVMFDRILGRLREKDDDGGGGGGGQVPDPTSHFTVTTTPNANQKYYADERTSPGMTVTVTLKFDGNLVDADATPNGWTHQSLGVYTKSVSPTGTVNSQQWSYTPGGEYEDRTAVKSSPARSLSVVYPAYWGIYPGNDATQRDITTIVAALKDQHRVTSNMPQTTVEVNNATEQTCWMWIVVKESGSATAEPTATPGISMMNAPVTGKAFTSPINNTIDLDGYKAYVSTFSAKAGASFGQINLTINL